MTTTKEYGYCTLCAENTFHSIIDTGSGSELLCRALRMIPFWSELGPWYCAECRRQVWRVQKELEDSHVRNGEFLNTATGARPTPTAGNYIRSEENLVARKMRSSRYSKKFRTSTVKRLLDGQHSVTKIADELELPQGDILAWVSEHVVEQQQRIEVLNKVLESMVGQGQELRQIKAIVNSEADFLDSDVMDSDVIEGNVKCR